MKYALHCLYCCDCGESLAYSLNEFPDVIANSSRCYLCQLDHTNVSDALICANQPVTYSHLPTTNDVYGLSRQGLRPYSRLKIINACGKIKKALST